jgi:hypothetical protein
LNSSSATSTWMGRAATLPGARRCTTS